MCELLHLNIFYFGIFHYHPLESRLFSKEGQKETDLDEREVRRNRGNREKGNLNRDILDEGGKNLSSIKKKKGRYLFLQLS